MRRRTGSQRTQATLEKSDLEGVTRHGGASELRQRRGEALPRSASHRLARTKPDQRLGRQTFTHGQQLRMQSMARLQRRTIQRLGVNECAAPLAVSPVLNFGDAPRRLKLREPLQRFSPRARSQCAVDSTERTVQPRAKPPAQTESHWSTPKLSRIENHELERIDHTPGIALRRELSRKSTHEFSGGIG